MKEGSLVRMTVWPLMIPIIAATAKVVARASSNGHCSTTRQTPSTRPEKASIEPIERSNSPPIMRSAAAMARMPSSDAGASTVIMPARVNIELSARQMKKSMTAMSPAMAPSSGRRIACARRLDFFRRVSAVRSRLGVATSLASDMGFPPNAGVVASQLT